MEAFQYIQTEFQTTTLFISLRLTRVWVILWSSISNESCLVAPCPCSRVSNWGWYWYGSSADSILSIIGNRKSWISASFEFMGTWDSKEITQILIACPAKCASASKANIHIDKSWFGLLSIKYIDGIFCMLKCYKCIITPIRIIIKPVNLYQTMSWYATLFIAWKSETK